MIYMINMINVSNMTNMTNMSNMTKAMQPACHPEKFQRALPNR